MSKKIVYTSGQQVGKCTFISESSSVNGTRRCIFRCICGNDFIAPPKEVKSNRTNTCGCGYFRAAKLRKDIIHEFKSEYRSWGMIKYRCYNKSCKYYHHYGGRGIKMCDRWFASFESFLEDMGPKPTPKHTVERLRVNEGYEPSNCVWLINSEQNWNKRNSVLVTYNGKTQSLPAWAKELGLSYKIVKHRIWKGFSPEKAFSDIRYDSKGRPESCGRKVFYAGEWLTMRDASERSGIGYNTIKSRLSRGIDPISGIKSAI